MTVQEAKRVAEAYISANMKSFDGDGGYTVYNDPDVDFAGWYFFYQTTKYMRSGDINDSVVGNSPIYVTNQGVCVGPKRPRSV